jgi:transcriptional regulator with XRE-family HTH domain
MELREYLFKHRKTQVEMAKQLGVSVNHFSQLVRHKRHPSIALAIKIEELTEGEVTKEELIFPQEGSEE